ncbi:MAG TPA: hypothetical protein VGC41_00515 [Kofleriaceae bacterium]
MSGAAFQTFVDQLIEAGTRAYPQLTPPPGLAEFVAARADAARAASDPDARAADLVLAAACTAGDPSALALLEPRLPEIIRPALARVGVSRGDDSEILQRVRIALFAPRPDAEPGIAGYSGRGELRAYLRAVAVRIALKYKEREVGSPEDDRELVFLPDLATSPAMRVIEQRGAGDLRAAFATALAELDPKSRLLLRQHYVDGLTIDVLGRLYKVHRATCARWIEAARGDVLRGIRKHLKAVLGMTDADLDSLVDGVRSKLDLSLSRLLPRT